MIVPLVCTDVLTEIYHRVCFPLYGLKCVNRSRYIKIDRHRLKYLNPIQKLNCAYCGYANGWLHYASIIAAETERYWCGIQHQANDTFIAPKHHQDFLIYGDAETLKHKFPGRAKP